MLTIVAYGGERVKTEFISSKSKKYLLFLDMKSLLKRFRGNLMVEGLPSFAEESWKHVTIGNHKFKVRYVKELTHWSGRISH